MREPMNSQREPLVRPASNVSVPNTGIRSLQSREIINIPKLPKAIPKLPIRDDADPVSSRC